MNAGAKQCPTCGPTTYALTVVNSRAYTLPDGTLTQTRRRECHKCNTRFNTVEIEQKRLEFLIGKGKAHTNR